MITRINNISTQVLQEIAKKYRLSLLILFGSAAKQQQHALGDIDLAFYRHSFMSHEEEQELWIDVMAALKREDIDLVNIYNNKSVLLRYQIFIHGQLIYEENPGLFSTMRWQAYIDFEDFKPFYKQKSELIDNRLNNMITLK
mgnify:CR=1 FL=1